MIQEPYDVPCKVILAHLGNVTEESPSISSFPFAIILTEVDVFFTTYILPGVATGRVIIQN